MSCLTIRPLKGGSPALKIRFDNLFYAKFFAGVPVYGPRDKKWGADTAGTPKRLK